MFQFRYIATNINFPTATEDLCVKRS